jgi:hypothetical protein
LLEIGAPRWEAASRRSDTFKRPRKRHQEAFTGVYEKRPIEKTFSALQRLSPRVTVRTKPPMTGGAQFGLLQYVGHVRPD